MEQITYKDVSHVWNTLKIHSIIMITIHGDCECDAPRLCKSMDYKGIRFVKDCRDFYMHPLEKDNWGLVSRWQKEFLRYYCSQFDICMGEI